MSHFRLIIVPAAATAAALSLWGISAAGDSARLNSPVHATLLAAAVTVSVAAMVCWAFCLRSRQNSPKEPDWKAECMATVRTLASAVAPDRREPPKTLPLRRSVP